MFIAKQVLSQSLRGTQCEASVERSETNDEAISRRDSPFLLTAQVGFRRRFAMCSNDMNNSRHSLSFVKFAFISEIRFQKGDDYLQNDLSFINAI
jgi:hypothetical protein